MQNFSLIQTVGCLATGPNNTWVLTRTAEPLTTREDVASDRGLATAASRPLGTRTFRLISVTPFKPESHAGQKMEARGLIYNEPGDERINLTSLNWRPQRVLGSKLGRGFIASPPTFIN